MEAAERRVRRFTAFSSDPAGGNPAGVVLDASALTAEEMLAIAAGVGFSETAFVTCAEASSRRFTVRYFSPRAEVPFCGHATVATAVALAEQLGPGELELATAAGIVPVLVEKDAAGDMRATLTSVEPYVEDIAEREVAEALDILGWRSEEIDSTLPPRVAYAGARHLVLAAAARRRLADLDYDFDRLAAYMTRRDLTTVQLVWRESATTFHVRDPFPVGGVVEDPATGAAAAALGAYLRELGLVGSTALLTLHQGDDMGRPSVLGVELRDGDPRIRVSGVAVSIEEA